MLSSSRVRAFCATDVTTVRYSISVKPKAYKIDIGVIQVDGGERKAAEEVGGSIGGSESWLP